MFDVGRLLAFAWAIATTLRARAWTALSVVIATAYFFAIAVVCGFTIRSQGPQQLVAALLLALVGPSALPRGPLPSFVPAGSIVIDDPASVNVVTFAALSFGVFRLRARIDRLPQYSEAANRADRVAIALALVAVFEAISAATRLVPSFLNRGLD